jgi:transcriptional regulator with XRE-family HTH domain
MPTQITEKQLERLKDLLPIYRKTLRFSAEKLAGFLGLERQQIGRLETGRTKLTQIHFHAFSNIISESIAELSVEKGINISLVVILVLLKSNEELLDDDEFLSWKDILIQLSKIDDVGDSENQIKLLKGFALASKDLNQGDKVPEIQVLDKAVSLFRDFLQSMNEIADEAETN